MSSEAQRQTQPILFPLSFIVPIRPPFPSSQPHCVLLRLLIYDLISTQCTHSGVLKTLCSHSMEPLSSLNALGSLLSHPDRSICIPISVLLWGEGRPETQLLTNLHRSSTHFTSKWFGSHSVTTSLHPCMLGIFRYASQDEILSWCLSHSWSSPINYAVVNPIDAQLRQTWTLLIKGSWKPGLASVFFLHNCVFENVRQGQCHIAKHMYYTSDTYTKEAGPTVMMTLLFAFSWIMRKRNILQVVCVSVLIVTHWGFCPRCPLSMPVAKGKDAYCACVYTLEWVHAAQLGQSNMLLPMCRFLSASCWNETRCCV